jgi:hypothetical protein
MDRAGKRKQALESRAEAAPAERVLTRSAAKKARVEPVPPLEKERRRRPAASPGEQAVARAPRSRSARRAGVPVPAPAEAAPEPDAGRAGAKGGEQAEEGGMDREAAGRAGEGQGGRGDREDEVRALLRVPAARTALRTAAARPARERAARLMHSAPHRQRPWSPRDLAACAAQDKLGAEAYNRQFATANRSRPAKHRPAAARPARVICCRWRCRARAERLCAHKESA